MAPDTEHLRAERPGDLERAVELAPDDAPMAVTRQAPRQVRMFSTATRISY